MTAAPWIQTRSGRAIDLLNPDPSQILLNDLAWALAHINRFTGHAGRYDVATHSINVAMALMAEGASTEVIRLGLMHDAHEAIVGDVSSPLKRAIRAVAFGHLDPFGEIEGRAWRAVATRFGLPVDLPEAVKVMDLRILLAEAQAVMAPPPRPWNVQARPWDGRLRMYIRASDAFHAFVMLANDLGIS